MTYDSAMLIMRLIPILPSPGNIDNNNKYHCSGSCRSYTAKERMVYEFKMRPYVDIAQPCTGYAYNDRWHKAKAPARQQHLCQQTRHQPYCEQKDHGLMLKIEMLDEMHQLKHIMFHEKKVVL